MTREEAKPKFEVGQIVTYEDERHTGGHECRECGTYVDDYAYDVKTASVTEIHGEFFRGYEKYTYRLSDGPELRSEGALRVV